MSFDIEKFFQDIFKPGQDEVLTILIDLPHGKVTDNSHWEDRREMAEDWLKKLTDLAPKWNMKVNPLVTYSATGANNADLPPTCMMAGKGTDMEELIKSSTIMIAMNEFSATAPLYYWAKNLSKLRIASMPGVAKFMEKSGLSADYAAIAEKSKKLVEIFDKAIAADVEFSSGHKCHFDLPLENKAQIDDGILHPERGGSDMALSNLPAGEVFCVPNENDDSGTSGELPEKIGDETAVYVIQHNKVVDVLGNGEKIEELRRKFQEDPARCNLAEFAIGINDKARVTGIVLEDEKAGFHWAYGRSDHFGGKIGVDSFVSKANVVHVDIVYAKGNPIVCSKLEMIFPDDSRQTLIIDGELQV